MHARLTALQSVVTVGSRARLVAPRCRTAHITAQQLWQLVMNAPMLLQAASTSLQGQHQVCLASSFMHLTSNWQHPPPRHSSSNSRNSSVWRSATLNSAASSLSSDDSSSVRRASLTVNPSRCSSTQRTISPFERTMGGSTVLRRSNMSRLRSAFKSGGDSVATTVKVWLLSLGAPREDQGGNKCARWPVCASSTTLERGCITT